MKNLLLLSLLLLIGTAGYAQNPIATAQVSPDSNCIFVTWNPIFENPVFKKPLTIVANGKSYSKNVPIGELARYSLKLNDTLADCPSTNLIDFTGSLEFTMFESELEFKFKDGEPLVKCPDNVRISELEDCLVFSFLDEGSVGDLPDTIRLNDTTYVIGEYFPNPTNSILFHKLNSTECDTLNMTPLLLTDTLYVGNAVCNYKEGLLPITILAFNYESEETGIALSWKVNSEEPARELYLQKSYDGVKWSNVYEQSLENYTTGQTMDGQFKDVSIEKPKLYYRLFISGYTGEVKYSSILPVTMENKVINTLFYQPQSRSIMIKAGQNYTGEMYLINAQGQNVMTQKIQMLKNTFQEVNVQGHLTPGIYFVKFDNGFIPASKLFISQ